MSKKITVNTKNYKYDIEDVGGNVYLHRTFVPDASQRHLVQSFQPQEMIFSGSYEDAAQLSNALASIANVNKTETAEPTKAE